jgi:hypothetical protein
MSGAQRAPLDSKQAPTQTGRLPVANRRGSSAALASKLGGGPTRSSAAGKTASAPEPAAAPGTHDSGLLGAPVTRLLPGSRETQFALLIVLTAAIFLLGVGAIPRQVIPHPGAAAFVARHRPLVAAAGLSALAAFLVSYFVS